jgi:DNA-binding transcriptional LysR family regulator
MVNPLFESFVQIVETGSLVRAGEVLHRTQPTITRHLQQLEQQLGMPLFNRVGKRLVLNQAGEIVYRYAKSHLALQDRMRDEVSALGDPNRGTIYLGAGLTLSIYILPNILSEYRRRHPQIRFHVRSGSSRETYTSLIQREVDIGIVTTLVGTEHVQAHPLFRDDLLIVASATHALASQPQLTFSQVAEHPFILLGEGSGLRNLVMEMTQSRGIAIQIAMETDSLESINRLVQCGAGISVLPRSSVQDDIMAGRLKELPVLDLELGARTVMLVTRTEGMLSAAAKQFYEFMKDYFSGVRRDDKE